MVNAVELGVAYLSLVVETSGIPTQVRRSLAGLPAEGRTAGAALGKQLSDAAARTASFDKLKASAGAAQLASAKATEALSAAQARARGASSALAVAEHFLHELAFCDVAANANQPDDLAFGVTQGQLGAGKPARLD